MELRHTEWLKDLRAGGSLLRWLARAQAFNAIPAADLFFLTVRNWRSLCVTRIRSSAG
jgi:hypothetical protein